MAPSVSSTSMKQEADNHLRQIRKLKGIDSPDREHDVNMKDLNRVLGIFSNQLYEKPTHFLLELIQNADDNTFESEVIPTLSFHLVSSENSWQMLIDCNEIGFTEENIDSLCSIGASTKKTKDRMKGYIGEKGIGFKSVFKVANVVHISSRGYSFRFDRRGMLGMITPIIETFPPANSIGALQRQTRGNETHILLELNGEPEFRSIVDELHMLKPQMLIFLRKIRRLIVHTPERDVQFEIQAVAKDEVLDGEETATLMTTSLSNGKTTKDKYLIVRRLVHALARDDRRENVKETEVVLAFPLEKGQPRLQAQDTYAYLPINKYGFNYLIQADFILLANRGAVDLTAEWNHRILQGVYRAFTRNAVPRFNQICDNALKGQSLRYTWPLYLKHREGAVEFWSRLKEWIFDRLGKDDVLESRQNGKLVNPKSLFYIPEKFRIGNEPLVENESSKLHHLSFLYDSKIKDTLPILKKMGVKEMQFRQFYQELRDVTKELGESFLKRQSREWHSKVADLIFQNRDELRLRNFDVPLVPLRDGRWVTPSQSLFFEGKTTDTVVPEGLDICLVDDEASQDMNRVAFFRWVGVRDCDQSEVCRMIMELYSPFKERSLNQSVQDLLYLFQTPRSMYKESLQKFQLLGAGKFGHKFMYAKRLYIEHPNRKSIISKYAKDPNSPMPILNSMYVEAVQKLGRETEFFDWACSQLKMCHLPRLVNEEQLPSPEFDFLKAHAVEDLLLLLRDNWDHYSKDIDPSSRVASKLKQAISEMRVNCIDGVLRPLKQTVLPLEALKRDGPHLVFIDLPQPDDKCWRKLSTFGVLTDLSIDFYLGELKALAAQPVTESTSKLAVEAIYAKLGSSKLATSVREAFANFRLVYLQKLKRWVSLSECVWNAPHQLRSVHMLSFEYPLCSSLFRNCLGLGNATLDDVIRELQSVTASTSFHELQDLLLLLNKYLKPDGPSGRLSKLKGKKIIPVTKPSGEERMDFDTQIFYLADRQSLWDRFNGKIPLIAFDVSTVRKLSLLIKAMNLSKYLLSEAVDQNLKMEGLPIKDKERTDDLRQRARYFVQLVTKETTETKSRLLNNLTNLSVWGVQEISLTQEVDDVKVTEDTGKIIFDDDDVCKLDIYISIKHSQEVKVDFELSKEFIRYCDITDPNFQKLVLPILQYPREDIENLLEEYGLYAIGDHDEQATELAESVSEESNDGSTPTPRVDNSTIFSPGTPDSGTDLLAQESSSPVSMPSSILRDRIPALDQSIASIQATAALPSTTPTLIITPSTIRSGSRSTSDNKYCETKGAHQSRADNESPSPGNGMGEAGESDSSTTHSGAETPHDAFEFRRFRSEFAEEFGLDSPSRGPRTPSTQHHSVPRYRRSPRYSGSSSSARAEPDPERTMQGFQNQKIGLLGETFVNGWLSRRLKRDWDPTLHWTSRNRNHLYPRSPYKGPEKGITDFTYPDTNGDLTKLLAQFGFLRDVQSWSSSPPTYHLEVKSTSESYKEPFYMSNSQVKTARDYTISWDSNQIPKNIYVVVRVFNLDKETSPGFTAYVDPWAMYLARELDFLAQDIYSVTLHPDNTANIVED